MLKKVLSWIMSAALAIGMMPMSALAEGVDRAKNAEPSEAVVTSEQPHWAADAADRLASEGIITDELADMAGNLDGSATRAQAVSLLIKSVGLVAADGKSKQEDNAAAGDSIEFSDITGHWAEEYIKAAVAAEYINGYPDGTFRPDDTITRAEIAKITAIAMGLQTKSEQNPFNDFSESDWSYQYVMACYDNGLLKGYEDGSFRADGRITCGESIAVTERAHEALFGEDGNTDNTQDENKSDDNTQTTDDKKPSVGYGGAGTGGWGGPINRGSSSSGGSSGGASSGGNKSTGGDSPVGNSSGSSSGGSNAAIGGDGQVSIQTVKDTSVSSEDRPLRTIESIKKEQQSVRPLETPETEEEPDYIKGRPYTQEEIDAENALVPKNLNAHETVLVDSIYANKGQTVRPLASADLPNYWFERYSYVRNQNPWGTCWAHSAAEMAEAYMTKYGMYEEMFSPLHIAYYMYHKANDPLGGTSGDWTKPLSSNYLENGGNLSFVTYLLARWTGFVYESDFPYYWADPDETWDTSWAYEDVSAHLENAYWVSMSDRDCIKQMIMEYGAVGISYNHNDSYYNNSTAAYYNTTGAATNHMVVLVGWNDKYSKTNFLSGKRPSTNGAWIVQNSWGESWGDDGYFYLSYEDTTIWPTAYAFEIEPADKYDRNYQYDGSAGGSYRYYTTNSDEMWGANVFTAQKNEVLAGVSFGIQSVNTDYSIQVYLNPTDGNPTSGTPMLLTPQTGSLDYCGYYTVELDTPVELKTGDKFAIVIKIETRDGGEACFSVDQDITYDWIRFYTNNYENQSYISHFGTSWSDAATSDDYCMRIKGLTCNAEKFKKITFNSNGGTSVDSIIARSGVAVTAPENPARSGYIFAGWYSDSALTQQYTFSTMPSSNITLYAKWSKIETYTLTINYIYQDGTAAGAKVQQVLEKNTPYSYTSPSIKGYTCDTPTVSGTIMSNVTADVTYTPITYTVKFNANGGSGTMGNQTFTYDAEQALSSNQFSRSGYAFGGWAKSASGNVEYTNGQSVKNLASTQGAQVNLYAKWVQEMFAGGSGTEADPYLIATAEQLAYLAALTNGTATYNGSTFNTTGKYFKLTADITINDTSNWGNWDTQAPANSWTPIGTSYNNDFLGTFDGDGHVVRGIYINNSVSYQGLFGYTSSGATIKNVGVVESYINCEKKYTEDGYNYGAGGVVGRNRGTVSNCYNMGTVSGHYYVGGVVGDNHDGTVTGCYNTGAVTGDGSVGGVVGFNRGTVSNCYNMGTVKGRTEVGGVVGNNYDTVTGCYNTGTVSVGSWGGGVVGMNYNQVSNSTFTVTVSNCYNMGTVSGSTVGGVVGMNDARGNSTLIVTGCYNMGTVSGSTVGGVVGMNFICDNAAAIVSNCYCLDTAYSGKLIGGGSGTVTDVAKKTAAQMKCPEFAALLDRDNDTPSFRYDKRYNNGFPILTWQEEPCVQHNWSDEWTIDVAATCTTKGSKSHHCTICDARKDVTEIALTSHSYTSKITTKPTCTKTGVRTYTCSVCGDSYTETIAATGHNWSDEWTIDVEPTYTQEGSKSHHCIICDARKDITEIPMLENKVSFAGGSGTEADPYLIATAEQLAYLAALTNKTETYSSSEFDTTGKYFKLTADITLNDMSNWGNWATQAPANEWTPIGTESNSFKGTFDGDGHVVRGIYINFTTDYQGLFGYSSYGTIKNVGVIESYIKGGSSVGGVVGLNYNGTVSNCYNTGMVSGRHYIGGVVGSNFDSNATVINCYNTGTVSSYDTIGGVVGENNNGTVSNCYNAGTVSGDRAVGGVVGSNNASSNSTAKVSNCYNTGTVSGSGYVGGVVGDNEGTVSNCYNTGTVSGSGYVGGVVGYNYRTVSNCYCLDTAYSRNLVGTSTGIVTDVAYKTAVQMKSDEFASLLDRDNDTPCFRYDERYNNGFPILIWQEEPCLQHSWSSEWTIDIEPTYTQEGSKSHHCIICDARKDITKIPMLENENGFAGGNGTEADPYRIATAEQLAYLAALTNKTATYNGSEFDTTGKYFKLTADIVLNDNASNYANWGTTVPANSWTPIGGNSNKFKGTFDGDGHVVRGIYINTTDSYQGLFGCTRYATIKNVGVVESYIKGDCYVGGVVGFNSGTVSNCYNTGTVSGYNYVGGVVGEIEFGTISNCYNAGKVIGDYVGGVVGQNYDGTVSNCYNTGIIAGGGSGNFITYFAGGVVGENRGTLKSCYNTGTIDYASGWATNASSNIHTLRGTSWIPYFNIGGVAGNNYSVVKDCYNTGYIKFGEERWRSSAKDKKADSIGGVIGCNYDAGSASNCYCLDTAYSLRLVGSNSSGTATNVTYKTADEMKCTAFASLLGNTEWKYISELNGGYPVLRSMLIKGESTLPTHTQPGKTEYVYPKFGPSETVSEIIPALGHSWSSEWTIDTEPTHTQPGSKSHHCTICDAKTDVTEIPALGFGGSGTEDDPYLIPSAEALEYSMDKLDARGVYFELTADIDADGLYNVFYGTFDGAGHTISGITGDVGLFKENRGVIKNLTVEVELEADGDNCGGICGTNSGTIVNCHVKGSISGTEGSVYGGIAGQNDGGIENCLISCTVDSGRVLDDEGYVLSEYEDRTWGFVVGKNGGEISNVFYPDEYEYEEMRHAIGEDEAELNLDRNGVKYYTVKGKISGAESAMEPVCDRLNEFAVENGYVEWQSIDGARYMPCELTPVD